MLSYVIPAPSHSRQGEGVSPLAAESLTKLAQKLLDWAPQASAAATTLAANVPAQNDTPDPSLPATTVTAILDTSLGAESYALTTSPGAWELRAGDAAGAFWAVQTFIQMTRDGVVPHVDIEDSPRYPVRGVMLDLSRNFFPVKNLEWLVDLAATYKFNQLHLHLSDDQGWRLEIPERPLLTELASGTDTAGGDGGFLTAQEYDDLQVYASARHVVIIPEIDFPGHTHAAMLAYPEISPDGEPREAYRGHEVGFSTLDLTSEASWAFIDDVVGSLARMTHGPRIHMGGDEALKLEKPDYLAFIERLGKVVTAHGKELTMWQEAGGAVLPAGSLIQYWTAQLDSTHLAQVAESQDIKFIASPGHRAYLDQKYDPDFPLGLDWAATIELRDAYDWVPVDELPGIPESAIAGVEACLWTETLHTFDHITTMFLPRLPALAEVAWGSPHEWERFSSAIAEHGKDWDAAGIAFHRSPQVEWK